MADNPNLEYEVITFQLSYSVSYNIDVETNTVPVINSTLTHTSITGIKIVTLTVSDGQLSTQSTFIAFFGEADSTNNPTPSTPAVDNTTSGAFIWHELFALFAFGMLYISRRKYS